MSIISCNVWAKEWLYQLTRNRSERVRLKTKNAIKIANLNWFSRSFGDRRVNLVQKVKVGISFVRIEVVGVSAKDDNLTKH